MSNSDFLIVAHSVLYGFKAVLKIAEEVLLLRKDKENIFLFLKGETTIFTFNCIKFL